VAVERVEQAKQHPVEPGLVAQDGVEAPGVPDHGRARQVAVEVGGARALLARGQHLGLDPVGAVLAPHHRGQALDEMGFDLVPGCEPCGEPRLELVEGRPVLPRCQREVVGGEAVLERVHGRAALALGRDGPLRLRTVQARGLGTGKLRPVLDRASRVHGCFAPRSRVTSLRAS
jgi:hypothetical protein